MPKKSKIDFLTEKIKTVNPLSSNIKRKEKEIASWFGDFYISSKDLVKDGKLPDDRTIALFNMMSELDMELLYVTLWDSIIYQVLTQEDFYVKEILFQILQTIHYVANHEIINAESDFEKKNFYHKELATAKVVLPDYLFVDSAMIPDPDQAFIVNQGIIAEDYIAMREGDEQGINDEMQIPDTFSSQNNVALYAKALKNQKLFLATEKKKQLELLKKDLEKAQKTYYKSYAKAHADALAEYQTASKPELDAYENALLNVEAGFTEETTEAQKKLARKNVPKPNVEDFAFDYQSERDVAFLCRKLKAQSLEAFAELFGEVVEQESLSAKLDNKEIDPNNIMEIGYASVILPEDECQNFTEMLNAVDEKISELNEEIYQNTEVEKEQYVSIGGVLIPANRSSTETAFTYQICAIKNSYTVDKYNFDLYLHMPDSSWDISRIYHHLNGGYTNGYYVKEISGNTIILRNLYRSGSLDSGIDVSQFPAVLEMHLFFTNGKTAVFTTSTMQPDTCVTGSFSTAGGTGNPNNPNTPTTTDATFIPKGFGIKRLGIADYLKVEQTTHAYVEGEVAHIENIMAREYREKSTRRLRKTENTSTFSSDTEREKLTDTTTASRFEMQTEIAKMQQEATDIGATANASFKALGAQFSVGASYANHRSKEESTRQAVTQAQDVTARALDRIVTKVHEERIEKIIEEFEENNTHGFDNKKGDKHVVGVYRWVDKLMKNQIFNYGKRMMFEFMIPQPAKLHTLAMESLKNGKVIDKPIDPRTSKDFTMIDYTALSNENVLKHWSSLYNIEVEEKADSFVLSKSFSEAQAGDQEVFSKTEAIEIPEGYKAQYAYADGYIKFDNDNDQIHSFGLTIGQHMELKTEFRNNYSFSNRYFDLYDVDKSINISYHSLNYVALSMGVNIYCQLSEDAKQQWQQKTFNAIIEAYETALTIYNQQIAEEETKAGNIKETNANFYRQIEQDILKHNCIAYVVDPKVLGTKLYDKENIETFEVIKEKKLDEYTALAKFMEQAFEWELMSYNFYPYFWGAKDDWQKLYQSESMDPLFRAFLQSGMGRVIVTVRPGFEDAVQFYMATGKIWNGGEVPVIGDPLYLSIVDELKQTLGESQGKPWITRLPTSLNILQAESIGLQVQQALSFTKEDPSLFEVPSDVITRSNFIKNDAKLNAGEKRFIENIDINNGYLQLTSDDPKREIVAQISMESIKKNLP